MRAKPIRFLSAFLLAGVAVAILGVAAWGARAYLRQVRLEVEVSDAASRVAAAVRSRAELVVNLIHASEAFGCPGSHQLQALRAASERARSIALVDGVAGEGPASEAYPELLAIQAELTERLDEVWPVVDASTDAGARAVLDDLRSSLARSGEIVGVRLKRLDRCLEAYRADTQRFPGSLIAAVVARGGLSIQRTRVAPAPDAPRTARSKLAG